MRKRAPLFACIAHATFTHADTPRVNLTEHIDVAIHWKGGFVSQHAVVRRVQAYDQLRDFDAIMKCVQDGHAAGLLSAQIAEQLQQAGFMTINPALPWDKHMVLALLRRSHLLPGRIEKIELAPDEWLLADLGMARRARRALGFGCHEEPPSVSVMGMTALKRSLPGRQGWNIATKKRAWQVKLADRKFGKRCP